MTSRRLELPADIAHTVVSMLTPTQRPFAVLCVWPNKADSGRMQARVKEGSVSGEERKLLKLCFNRADSEGFWNSWPVPDVCQLVHMALALEFVFRTEADRARWCNGEAFEMYRDAVRAIA